MANVLKTPGRSDDDDRVRSSFEIMGCDAPNNKLNQSQPVAGVGATMSRPPSSMPDFGFVGHNDTLPGPVAQIAESPQDSPGLPIVQFSMALALFLASGGSTVAAIVVLTTFGQIGKPVTAVHDTWLILSIFFFVLGLAGFGHVLFVSPEVIGEVKRKARGFPSTIHWPAARMPSIKTHVRWLQLHLPFTRMRRAGDFELDDLESGPPRPPTPYPAQSAPTAPHSTEHSQQGHAQTLPLGFPVPPTGEVNRMNSAVSRMSNTSFQSDPRSVSPLSDAPPTPPPKDAGFSRFQSREPLLPPAVFGHTVAQSDTRASILTTLCDAVQLSNPDNEPGRAAQNYSPLAMTSSPATGTTGGNSASVQSPKPAYPVELASPSRGKGKEHEG